MNLGDIKIILARPAEPGNVGAVCRVMKTAGLSKLAIVSPEFSLNDASSNLQEIHTRAVHSGDIWENASHFDSLKEAVKDCSIVIGTTRRRGSKRKSISMTPRELVAWLADKQIDVGLESAGIAIVFGNERTGLDESELNLCNFASHIPASDDQGSLNLSHAVQIYAYELFLACQGIGSRERGTVKSVKGSWTSMTQDKINFLVSEITDKLKEIGFYKQGGREDQERFLRDLIARAGLSESEGKYLRNLLVKAGRLGK